MKAAISSTLVLLGSLPVFAGVSGDPSFSEPLARPVGSKGEWSFNLSLYGWAESLEGDISVRGNHVPVDLKFDDLLDYIDMAAMGAVGFKYDRWGILLDVNYAEFSARVPTPLGIVAPVVDLEQTQWLANAIVSYEAYSSEATRLDVFAGARLNSVEVDLGINRVRFTNDQTWLDPIIGLRFQQELSPSFFFRSVGDIGGFGVSSDLTWQGMAALGWHFSEHGNILLGYRAIDTDYVQGDFAWDVNSHGPILGLEFIF
jgi:hypothetical protein